MRRITRDELAELREEAARVCEETKSLIEEAIRLRKWADGVQDELGLEVVPAIQAPPRPTVTGLLRAAPAKG